MSASMIGHVLVTGGAGFVGTNLAARLAQEGNDVVVFDNLSRPGVERNLRYLRAMYPERIRFERGDVRDQLAVRRAIRGADSVFHLAAQVAVTTSLDDPVDDFTVNALGTLNVLEEARQLKRPPFVLFTSTNKVYGNLEDIPLEEVDECWLPVDPELVEKGLGESRPLAFCTPYGCSKGAADQYVLDYAKSYGMPATVFRMSCIYGPHQCGNEDQGWVAHFARRALERRPITVYGDGHQVRDILFADDLVDAMLAARESVREVEGQAFNIGGGPANAVSLHDVLQIIEEVHGELPDVSYDVQRTGDQRYYVSDTTRFESATGWRARVSAGAGLAALVGWLAAERPSARTRVVAR
jgi:CDP-paratose 2-epimerase